MSPFFRGNFARDMIYRLLNKIYILFYTTFEYLGINIIIKRRF